MGPLRTPGEMQGSFNCCCPNIALDILDLYDKVDLAGVWQQCEERMMCKTHYRDLQYYIFN